MSPVHAFINDLRALPCLSGLSVKELSVISEMARVKYFNKNDVIFEEAEPVEFFFIIQEGKVKLYKTSKDGRELIVKIMGSGDYFCCAPVYSGGTHLVGAIAIGKSTLIVIPANTFRDVMQHEVSEMGWRIIGGLCNKIRSLSDLVENVTFRDVEERVMMTLLHLAEEQETGDFVTLTVTHQNIASLTGTVREVVSRTMLKMKKQGIITDSTIKGFTIDKAKLAYLLNKRHLIS
jgi:CRP/FNR family transcriptional regulator